MKLGSEKGTLVRLRKLNVGTLFTRKPQKQRHELQKSSAVQIQHCSCTDLKSLFQIPCSAQQNHIILRHSEQWPVFHTDHRVFTQNA